jgi:hypothetical protein
MFSVSMGQRVLIKYLWEEDDGPTQIHFKLIEHYGDKTLSYPDLRYWVLQFRMGRESVENSRRNGRPPDFQARFRIEGTLEASPSSSLQCIAEITGIAP